MNPRLLRTLMGGAALLLIAAAGFWLARHTEWVDVQVPTPPSGAAKDDPHYAIKQIVRRLGATVVTAPNLERLPPAGATLVLSSRYWDLLPGAVAALQGWVEAGGRLVVPSELATRGGGSSQWIPIERIDAPRARPAPESDTPPAQPPAADPLARCPHLREPADLPSAFGEHRIYRVCGFFGNEFLKARATPLWALDDARGHQWLRVQVGRGSVTATGRWDVSSNGSVLRADDALATVAALALAPGQTVWFVVDESRPGLLSVIWSRGAPVVLLAALLVLVALWRGAPRFGPALPRSVPGRRSIAEQVRGTAAFIATRGPAALHRAQFRALEEAARGRLPGISPLDRRRWAEAVARLTALDAEALARAMEPSLRYERGELLAALVLLETARRRLSPPGPPRPSRTPR